MTDEDGDDAKETAELLARLHAQDAAFHRIVDENAPRIGARLDIDRALRQRRLAVLGASVSAFIAFITHSPIRRWIALAMLATFVVSALMATARLARLQRILGG